MTVSANSSTSAGGLASAVDRDAPDEPGRQPRQGGDVVAEQLGHPGPLHLDHDLLAGAQAGGVHLGDRRRRDRGLVEPLEQLLERTAEVDLDHRAHVGEGLGRHLVAQELELGDQLVGEQALATGDDLAELHVARAQPLERACGAAGRCRRVTTAAATRTASTPPARRRSRRGCD